MNKIKKLNHKLLEETNCKVGIIKSNIPSLELSNYNRKLIEQNPYIHTMAVNFKKLKEEDFNYVINALGIEDEVENYTSLVVFADFDFIDLDNLNELQTQILLHELGHIINNHPKNELDEKQNELEELEADSYMTNPKICIEYLSSYYNLDIGDNGRELLARRVEALRNRL